MGDFFADLVHRRLTLMGMLLNLMAVKWTHGLRCGSLISCVNLVIILQKITVCIGCSLERTYMKDCALWTWRRLLGREEKERKQRGRRTGDWGMRGLPLIRVHMQTFPTAWRGKSPATSPLSTWRWSAVVRPD